MEIKSENESKPRASKVLLKYILGIYYLYPLPVHMFIGFGGCEAKTHPWSLCVF